MRSRLRSRIAVLPLVLALLAGWAGFAPPAQAASAAPRGLRTTAVATQAVGLTWDGTESGYYRVRFSANSSMSNAQTWNVVGNYFEWTQVKPSPNTISARLTAGRTYYFQVRTINAKKTAVSSYSKAIKVTLPSSGSSELPPVDLTATAAGSTSLYLSWSSRGPGVKYRVRYTTNPSTSVTTWKSADFDVAGGTLTGLAANTKYYFKIRVINTGKKALSKYSSRLTASTRTASPALTVVSYNVLKANSGPSWDTRRKAVATTIRAQNPAIVGLQEATSAKVTNDAGETVAQYTDLIDLLGDKYSYVTSKGSSGTKLAYDTTRLTLKNQGVQELTTLGTATRYAVWAVLEDKQTPKQRVFVVNTHLEPGGDSAEANTARQQQATEILALIKAKNPKNWPVLVIGDLNSSRNNSPNAPYEVFTKTLVDPIGNAADTWRLTSAGTAEHRIDLAYNTATALETVARRTSYPVGTRVDYIFTSKGVRVALAQTVVDLNTQGEFVGTIGSDHNLIKLIVHLT